MIDNKYINNIIKLASIYLLWICLHFIASNLYSELCTHISIMGFITSPFLTLSPQCQALRWVIQTGANTINNMWIVLGTFICTKLISLETI